MDKQLKKLRLRQLDDTLEPLVAINLHRPKGGWIRSIRQALGMSASQLADRIGVSRQAVFALEQRESLNSVSLEALEKAAQAMDAHLVYAIVPNTTLGDTLRKQARKKVAEKLSRVAHTMQLEDQGVPDEETKRQLKDSEQALLDAWPTDLWSLSRAG